MKEKCVHRNTYEEEQADRVRLPWDMLKESLTRAGISQYQFKDYDEMLHDSRIMALLTKRHFGFDMSNQLQQPQPGIDAKGLEGFVAYGLKLKEKSYLPGVEIEYLGYKCNSCGVLSIGAPEIQTITGRNDPLERSLGILGRTYPGQGIIYTCGNSDCKKDMLVRIVKEKIVRYKGTLRS